MSRSTICNLLLVLMLCICVVASLRLRWEANYFAQPNAATYVVKLAAILVFYAVLVLWVRNRSDKLGDIVVATALPFGLATGVIEVLNVAIENGLVSLSFFSGNIPQVVGILSAFILWGVAGFRATRLLNSVKQGVLTSVASSVIGMLIGVCGGVAIEMFVAPADPRVVATWQEFKRSRWIDPAAFQVANTLDSAFDHLLLAPVVAATFGGVASILAKVFPVVRQATPPA